VRSIFILTTILLSLVACSKQQFAPQGNPTVSAPAPEVGPLLATIQKTLSDLESGRPAAWIARYINEDGTHSFDVDVVRHGTNMTWSFLLSAQRTNGFYLRIVQTNGVWLVQDGANVSRWRPYEAPLNISGAYALLDGSEPIAITAETLERARFISSSNSFHTYSVPPDPQQRTSLQGLIEQLRKLAPELQSKDREKMNVTINMLTDQLENGVPLVIDAGRGVIRRRPIFRGAIRILNFTWLEAGAPQWGAFEIDDSGATISDNTTPITQWNLNECVVVMHDPAFAPMPDLPSDKVPLAPDPYI
jgi:hypothetical protein